MNARREDSCQSKPVLWKKRLRFRKFISGVGLRPRLLSAFFLVSLVPLVILFCAQYQITKRSTIDIIEKNLIQVADVQQRRLNHELQRLSQQLLLVASRTQMRISLKAFNQTHQEEHLGLLRQILTDALLSTENFVGIWVRNSEDMLVTGVYSETIVVDSVVIPPVLNTEEIQLDLEWMHHNVPNTWVSGPLFAQDERIGSVHLLVNLADLYAVLDDFSCEQTSGETLLLLRDKKRDIKIVRPSCPTRKDNSLQFYRLLESGIFHEDMMVERTALTPLHDRGQIMVMRSLDHAFGHIFVHVSTDGLDSAFWYQMRFLLGLALFSTGLVLFMALGLSRMIAQPLQRLTQVTSGLRDGSNDVRIRERFWGEFTDVTRSFNRAMRMLSKRTAELRQEIEARRRSQQKLVDLANTDTLTGLINRRFFMEKLREVLSSPGRERQPAALLYLDLDDFKPINDKMGHEAGDLVLQVVAGRIRHLLREGDMAARLGGDEFALLLMKDGTHHLDPDMVARRVEEQLSMPMTIKNQVVTVGSSIGVVRLSPGDDPEEVINRADQNMYLIKHARRSK